MQYLLVAVLGGLFSLSGMRACEKIIDNVTGKKLEPLPYNNNKIKYSLVFVFGSLSVLGSIYLTKNILKK